MTEKVADVSKTLGQAIDEIIRALEPLEQASRITAIRASCEHLNISLGEKPRSTPSARESSTPEAPIVTPSTDIRKLKEEKMPASAIEMAALVTFYLSELAPEQERKTEVKVKDMVKYFKQASFKLPKRPEGLLRDAKDAGYFDSVGRGAYKLNPVGYNLVVHSLPRSQSKAKQAEPSRKS